MTIMAKLSNNRENVSGRVPVELSVVSPKLVAAATGLFFLFVGFSVHTAHAGDAYSQRIVSLGPAVTESIYLLHSQDRLVGVTTYCVKPHEAQAKEKIGTVRQTNIEKVVSLRPDLVVATSLTDPKVVEKLTGLGIRVVRFSQPKNFEEICSQFMSVAALTGKEKEGLRITDEARAGAQHIRRNVEGLQKPRVFFQIGAKPVYAVTGSSVLRDFIGYAGGVNIAADAADGIYSREEVLRENPDVIVIATMGIAGEKEKETWEKYKTLSAVQNNRIFIVDSEKLCSPTPLSFVRFLEEMAGLLHPADSTADADRNVS